MGYDLKAKNKDKGCFNPGWVTWGYILKETGCGYLIGYGEGRAPASYVYQSGNNGSPMSNDGYKVSASEAKTMAKLCNGFVSVKRFINKDWDSMEPLERKRAEEFKFEGTSIYQSYINEDLLTKIEKFAEWANDSGGFTIH